jgi:chromosomal replication initiator protein DnaA
MRRDRRRIEQKLNALVEPLRGADSAGVAKWTLRALPRFSSWVRELPAAWVARVMAEQRLGHRLHLEPSGEVVPPEVWPLLRGTLSATEVWARLVEDGVELGRGPLLGGHRFTVPLTEPVALDIEGRRISLAQEVVRVRAQHPISIWTLDGTVHTLAPTTTAPRASAMIRWAAVSNLLTETHRSNLEDRFSIEPEVERPIAILFVAGDVTWAGAKESFDAAVARISNLTKRLGDNRTVVLAVPGNHDATRTSSDPSTAFENYSAFAEKLPRPGHYVTGKRPGDFAAVCELEGARIGVVGLNTCTAEGAPALDIEQLHALCGPEPERWTSGHDVAILLTHHTPNELAAAAPDLFPSLERLFAAHIFGAAHGPYARSEASPLRIGSPSRPDSADDLFTVSHGSIDIGTSVRLDARTATFNRANSFVEREHVTREAPRLRDNRARIAEPATWIIVSSHAKATPDALRIARELGIALATAGYGIALVGRGEFESEVSLGFASTHAGSDSVRKAVRHYLTDRESSSSLPGTLLFFPTAAAANSAAVAVSAAVVQLGGRADTAATREGRRHRKPIVTIPFSANARRRPDHMTYSVVTELRKSLSDRDREKPILSAVNSGRYQFDNFVVGSGNQLAYAAARAIADNPKAAVFNPLFIYGPSGSGKTHLLHALASSLRKSHPELDVICVTTETFVVELISAIRYDRLAPFRERARGADLLLLDDIQFIAGKERMQEEFYHLLNVFDLAQKQIVFTCDRQPKLIPTLEDRITAFFLGGLLADIQAPDFETRVAVMMRKAEAISTSMPMEVFVWLAEHLGPNVRELEGYINRIAAYASLHGRAVTLPLAREAVKDWLDLAEKTRRRSAFQTRRSKTRGSSKKE